jgi:hypothetical protein
MIVSFSRGNYDLVVEIASKQFDGFSALQLPLVQS